MPALVARVELVMGRVKDRLKLALHGARQPIRMPGQSGPDQLGVIRPDDGVVLVENLDAGLSGKLMSVLKVWSKRFRASGLV
jgi:hypothetical protein